MRLLEGKQALVCGSSQGIGKAIALHFANLGAELTLLARNATALQAVSDQLSTEQGQNHGYFTADFSNPNQLKQALTDGLRGKSVNILVNNTGGPPGGIIHEADPEEFMDAFSQHLICNQLLVSSVLKGMKFKRYGRIINIISTSVKQPLPDLGVSNTIRGAVASWSKTLAGELAPFGITVNNVLPGATDTARLASILDIKAKKLNKSVEEVAEEMKQSIPMGRFARPEDIAYAVGFLASDLASYVTGINLPVDGGRIAGL